MEEIASVKKDLLIDRGVRKVRLNIVRKNNIMGCIVPYDR